MLSIIFLIQTLKLMVQCRIRTIRKILWGEGGQYPVPIPPQRMSWPIEKPVLRFDRGSLKIR